MVPLVKTQNVFGPELIYLISSSIIVIVARLYTKSLKVVITGSEVLIFCSYALMLVADGWLGPVVCCFFSVRG